MGTFGQQYMLPLAQVGQDRVLRGDSSRFNNNITETGNALNLGVGGSALALQALQPAVLNNLQYAPEYMDAVNTYSDFASGVDMYNKLQMGVNMTNPEDGNAYFSEAFGLGNTFETGALLGLSAINPAVGVGMLTNALTSNEDNPFGSVPLVSDLQEGISNFSDWLNSTQVGGNITSGLSGLYDNVFKPITNSVPGKYANAIAQLPLDFTDAVVSTLGEGYEFIDGSLFGGYLPGGQTDDPESQEFNNPLQNLEDRLNDMSSLYKTQDRLDAEVAYDKFTPIKQGLVDDLVDSGVPYQLAVDSIYDPGLLAGYSDLWVTDYGRKVAEVEYSPEAIEAFNIYARDPDNNPFNTERLEGVSQVPDGVKIDPMMGLLKPADDSDQSIVELSNYLSGENFLNEQEMKQVLGDNYIDPLALEVYNTASSSTLQSAKDFASDGQFDSIVTSKGADGESYGLDNLHWVREYAKDSNGAVDYDLVENTFDFINDGAKQVTDQWNNSQRIEIGLEQFDKIKSDIYKKPYSRSAWGGYKLHKSGYENTYGGWVQMLDNMGIRTKDTGKKVSDLNPLTLTIGMLNAYESAPYEFGKNAIILTKNNSYKSNVAQTWKAMQTEVQDSIPEYTYDEMTRKLLDSDYFDKGLEKYSEIKNDLGITESEAKQIGLSFETLKNREEFEKFTSDLSADFSSYMTIQNFEGFESELPNISYNLPNGVENVLSNIESGMGGDSHFSDYIATMAFENSMNNNTSSDYVEGYQDWATESMDFYNPTSTAEMFNDYQQAFTYNSATNFTMPEMYTPPPTINVGGYTSTYNPSSDTYSIPYP